ncbi:MAG: ferredoxin [Thermoleophilaceae bacterium]
MKVVVDFDVCEAHDECVVAAPEIFELGDDDEVVTVLQEEPPEDQASQAEEAAKVCPVAAIKVEG